MPSIQTLDKTMMSLIKTLSNYPPKSPAPPKPRYGLFMSKAEATEKFGVEPELIQKCWTDPNTGEMTLALEEHEPTEILVTENRKAEW